MAKSSSYTFLEGISPDAILQNMQLSILQFLLSYFLLYTLYNAHCAKPVYAGYINRHNGVYKLLFIRLYDNFNVCVGMSPNKAVLFLLKQYALYRAYK